MESLTCCSSREGLRRLSERSRQWSESLSSPNEYSCQSPWFRVPSCNPYSTQDVLRLKVEYQHKDKLPDSLILKYNMPISRYSYGMLQY